MLRDKTPRNDTLLNAFVLDGGQHVFNNEKDKKRDEWFKNQGYDVLRFWDNDVLRNKDGVLETVRKKLLTPHLTSPTRGEEKQ